MKRYFTWRPPYDEEEACRQCSQSIRSGALISVEDYEARNVANGAASTLHCTSCTVTDILIREFKNQGFRGYDVKDAINDIVMDILRDQTGGLELGAAIRNIVREELKTIMREEAHDPHGPVSPD